MTMYWPHKSALERLHVVLGSPAGRRVGVVGLGVVGMAVAQFLAKQGAQVLAYDKRTSIPELELLRAAGVECLLGTDTDEAFGERLAGLEALAISPGVDPRQHILQRAHEADVPLFGELELHHAVLSAIPTIAVTGTNGKSTTVELMGELLQAAGLRVFVGGNLGPCITTWIEQTHAQEHDVAVLELSSFQLERAYRYRCMVAIVLNLSPDHTDRYDTESDYAEAKTRWLCNLGVGDRLILGTTPSVRDMGEKCAAVISYFGALPTLRGDNNSIENTIEHNTGVFVDHTKKCLHAKGFEGADVLEGLDLTHECLFGTHNDLNAAAALQAVVQLCQGLPELKCKLSKDALERAYKGFRGLAHRIELVAEVNGVQFINDSKATNDESSAVALQAMQRPVLLLLGGRDKRAGYKKTIEAAKGITLRGVIAFGEAAETIGIAFRSAHNAAELTPTLEQVPNLKAAFGCATGLSVSGDAILLSPACSSFDEFENYAERGKYFKALVAEHAARHQNSAEVSA